MIQKNLAVGPLGTNCYIIGDENTKIGAIIDPGSDAVQILHATKSEALKIAFIICTHGHFDHCGAVAELKRAFQCDFLLHREDLSFIQESKRSAANWGFDIEEAPQPDQYLTDNQILSAGSIKLKVIYTPGHTPGGISLYIKDFNILFSGDTLFYRSIGRTDFRLGSMEDITASIRNKLYQLPDHTLVYTGHGEPTTIGDEKKYNFFVRP